MGFRTRKFLCQHLPDFICFRCVAFLASGKRVMLQIADLMFALYCCGRTELCL